MYLAKVDGKLIKNDNLDHIGVILDYLLFRKEITEEHALLVKSKFAGVKKHYEAVIPPFKYELPYFVDDEGNFYRKYIGVEEQLKDNFILGVIGEGVYSFNLPDPKLHQTNVGVIRD